MRHGLQSAAADLSRFGTRQIFEHVRDCRPLEGRQLVADGFYQRLHRVFLPSIRYHEQMQADCPSIGVVVNDAQFANLVLHLLQQPVLQGNGVYPAAVDLEQLVGTAGEFPARASCDTLAPEQVAWRKPLLAKPGTVVRYDSGIAE